MFVFLRCTDTIYVYLGVAFFSFFSLSIVLFSWFLLQMRSIQLVYWWCTGTWTTKTMLALSSHKFIITIAFVVVRLHYLFEFYVVGVVCFCVTVVICFCYQCYLILVEQCVVQQIITKTWEANRRFALEMDGHWFRELWVYKYQTNKQSNIHFIL